MDRNKLVVHKRWAEPVLLLLFFAFCSSIGLGLGLMVRTTSREVKSIAVLPGARDVATPTMKPVGLGSPTVKATNSTAEGLLNYEFRTSSTPNAVITSYKDLLLHHYGFQNWSLEESSPGLQVLRFMRDINPHVVGSHGVWDREIVTVLVSQNDAGQVKVTITREVQAAQ